MSILCTLVGSVLCLAGALASPVVACLAVDRLPPRRAMAALLLLNVAGTALFIVGVVGLIDVLRMAWGALG